MAELSDRIIRLTPAERANPLWAKLSAALESRLHSARQTNDGNLTMEETFRLRGRIAELKAFLRMGEETPTMETFDT